MGSHSIVLVASDAQSSAVRIRAALIRQGVACPHSRIVSLELAASYCGEQQPAVIFVPLPPDRDHAIQALRRLRAATGAKIVAIGAASTPKDVLDVIHAGANDYLDESEGFEGELKSLLERMRSEETTRSKSGCVLSLISASGGSGVSVVATNLAAELAQRHGRCGLIDLRHPRGDLQSLLNLKPLYTLGDLCRNVEELDQAMLQQALVEHACGVSLIASNAAFDAPLQHSEALLRIIQLARMTFSHVVVDLGGTVDAVTPAIIQGSEIAAIVMRLDVVSVVKTRRMLEYLSERGIAPERLFLIGNRCGQPGELRLKPAERAVGRRLTHCLPDDPKAVNGSINVGSPAVLEAPGSKFSKAIRRTCDELFAPFDGNSGIVGKRREGAAAPSNGVGANLLNGIKTLATERRSPGLLEVEAEERLNA